MSIESGFTLQQLRIFWTIANSPSLTQAAKVLGITQPSLSQHLAKLEAAVGGRLFDRGAGQLAPTDAGRYLLERAERILADTDETLARLVEYLGGERGRVAIAMLPTVGRALLPFACAKLADHFPDLELDVHELAPPQAIDQLYGRNLQLAVLSASALTEDRLSFSQTPIISDPYVLAVPSEIDLDGVHDPIRQLESSSLNILRRIVMFDFGSSHSQRTEELYRRLMPGNHVIARCRSYDTALALVEAGRGVAVIPQLAAETRDRRLFNIQLYQLPVDPRRVVAVVPNQYRRVEPFKTLLKVLVEAGKHAHLSEPSPVPPFIAKRLDIGAN